MNRRQFILGLARCGLSAGLLGALPPSVFAKKKIPNPGIWIIDAHAHPYTFYRDPPNPNEHTFDMIREAGIVCTSIAAVGDYVYSTVSGDSAYSDTLRQLSIVQQWEDQGYIKIIREPQQIRRRFDPDAPIGAILTIEGGDALEGDLAHLDEFYEMGVRMITLVHNFNNEIGNDMRQYGSADPDDDGLTEFGYQVVERMNALGMLIDVTHSSTQTLYDIADCTQAPVIDSHINPLPQQVINRGPGRLRTYTEIEAIVDTGGVVCTWPLAYMGAYPRETFGDWVQEIMDLRDCFGIKYVGLGTDSGGGLPDYVDGWENITDLNLLDQAMIAEGFHHRERAAFMGDNVLKVLYRCFAVSQGLKRSRKAEII
jgi:microsomal dipeptidase-like Zn-dependent dipeptidase